MSSQPDSEDTADSRSSERPTRRPWRNPKVLVVLSLLLAVLTADLLRPPREQLSARILLGAIDLYQATLSPRIPAVGIACRFEPTCSRYTEAAIQRDGALIGSLRGAARILRCGPWTEAGTVDEP